MTGRKGSEDSRPKMKSNKPHVVPQARQVAAHLENLRRSRPLFAQGNVAMRPAHQARDFFGIGAEVEEIGRGADDIEGDAVLAVSTGRARASVSSASSTPRQPDSPKPPLDQAALHHAIKHLAQG